MTDVHDLIKEVETTTSFKEFRRDNPDMYLVHVFTSKGETELGYYDREADRITAVETDPVAVRPPEEIFKESGSLMALDLRAVKIGIDAVKRLAREFQEGSYPAHPIQQQILILQQDDAPIWRCTLVTQTLNMILLQLDATDGSVLSSDLKNILDLRK